MQISSVTQTFHLICTIELRSELMLNAVALNERLELGAIRLIFSRQVASVFHLISLFEIRCSPYLRFSNFVERVWQLISK